MKNCPNCNMVSDDDAVFCNSCGTKLPENDRQPETVQPQVSQPVVSENSQSEFRQPEAAQPEFRQPEVPQPEFYRQEFPQTPVVQQAAPQGMPPYPVYAQMYDPYDHTAEFNPKDISDNKVICMLVYLLGTIGIIIAQLSSTSSPYVAFHVRQALKFLVADILVGICAVFLCWTIIVPIAAGIMFIVLFVIKIISFFQICSGKAKEPAIIRSLKFLK